MTVQCFMLEEIPVSIHEVMYFAKDDVPKLPGCDCTYRSPFYRESGHWPHLAEESDPERLDWSKLENHRPKKCQRCEFVFTRENSNMSTGYYHRHYRNPTTGLQGILRDVLTPGAMYWADWYDHTPEKEGHNILSVHYWRDWCGKRAPLMVVCPDGSQWCVDQKSNNGTGWEVKGTAPNITAAPSIVVPGYHGFLQNGIFTNDIEGRPL